MFQDFGFGELAIGGWGNQGKSGLGKPGGPWYGPCSLTSSVRTLMRQAQLGKKRCPDAAKLFAQHEISEDTWEHVPGGQLTVRACVPPVLDVYANRGRVKQSLSVKSSVESKLRKRMCVGDTFGSSSRPL